MKITTGAPKRDVTAEIDSSRGEKTERAMKSQRRQKKPPPKKTAGIKKSAFDVFEIRLIKKGTAIPTNETEPAKAATEADKSDESKIKSGRMSEILTPIERA